MRRNARPEQLRARDELRWLPARADGGRGAEVFPQIHGRDVVVPGLGSAEEGLVSFNSPSSVPGLTHPFTFGKCQRDFHSNFLTDAVCRGQQPSKVVRLQSAEDDLSPPPDQLRLQTRRLSRSTLVYVDDGVGSSVRHETSSSKTQRVILRPCSCFC